MYCVLWQLGDGYLPRSWQDQRDNNITIALPTYERARRGFDEIADIMCVVYAKA